MECPLTACLLPVLYARLMSLPGRQTVAERADDTSQFRFRTTTDDSRGGAQASGISVVKPAGGHSKRPHAKPCSNRPEGLLARPTHQLLRGLFPSPSLSADHLASLQTLPSPQPPSARSPIFLLRQKANGGRAPTAHDRSRINFLATKLAHRTLSTNPLFLWGESEPHLATRGADQHYGVGACSSRGICW